MKNFLKKTFIEKPKSFFLNKKDRYTKWGVIVNWLIIIVPILIITIMFFMGNKITGNTKGLSIEEIKKTLSKTTIALVFIWGSLFFFFIYLIFYKLFRLIRKPKKVRDRNTKTLGNNDTFWNDK